MTVIANAGLVLKDSQGNKGIVKSFTDNDIDKISNAITDVGQVVDPATHMPIEATKTSAGVVQLATAQDITNGTAGKVVDAQELNNFAQTLPSVNGVTDVSSGDNSNQIVVSKFGGSKTLTIDNVEHADNADEATHATQADTATSANSVSWDNVSGKSTTLSGYGITDAYTKAQVDKKVSDLVNSAPETLDTLNELANALGNDPNFATTVATQIGTKANDSDVVHKSGDETISGTKTFTSRIVGSIDKAESAKSADSVAWDNVSGKPSTFTPSSHTHDDRYYTESEIDTKLSGKANATDLTNLMGINNGNDYFNPRDITNLIYAGNGAGTLRAQIAQGDFRNVHPGDYIIGKSTGTKWIVAHNDYWFNRGDSPLTRHHLCLIPEILAGNSGNLLWSGRTYVGSDVNNTSQGYAPWASDNWSEGKNNTSGAYYNSFIKQSILPKVYTYWLKKDFEDQGISLLTFRNLLSNAINTNAPAKGYSAWTGASSNWRWYDSKCDLLSEANVYGNNHWQSSGFDSDAQKEQLALFKFRHTLEVWGRQNVWFQDVTSSSYACICRHYGNANFYAASNACLVAPFCLIA